jgi:hypothetical protein
MTSIQMVWLGVNVVASAIAACYGMLAVHMWLRSRSVLGRVSPETEETLRTLLEVSRQKEGLKLVRLVLIYGGLGAFIVVIAAREWLGLLMAASPFALIKWMDIRTNTAPVVLILGTSSYSSIRRQRTIKRRLSPLRVISLLDVEVPWDPSLTNEMALDSFRTTNEDDWWLAIQRLMEIAPILALDTAAETSGVHREARHILSSDLWGKCLFLTPPDGSAPVLNRHLTDAGLQKHDLMIAQYEQASRVLAGLVVELQRKRG